MNGALTIGTLDGANIEIREEVGHDNFFLFGLTAEQINETMKKGYDPSFIYRSNEELCEVIGIMESGLLSSGDKELFKPLVQTLVSYDTFMLLADYPLYVACQDYVNQVWSNKNLWATMSVRNVARIGKFSSDRSIREYCEKIWHVKPCSIQ